VRVMAKSAFVSRTSWGAENDLDGVHAYGEIVVGGVGILRVHISEARYGDPIWW